MNASDRQSAELREKNASLSKAKVCAESILRKLITACTHNKEYFITLTIYKMGVAGENNS